MNKNLELQLEFQKLAGQNKFEIDQIPDIEIRKLRLKLSLYKLEELAIAFGMQNTFINLMKNSCEEYYNTMPAIAATDIGYYNKKEVLDALIDIEIINNGTIITCGLQNIFDTNYEMVDTNNKTKFHKNYLEALKTQKYYKEKNIDTEIEEIKLKPFTFYTVKNNYGKVLKPYNYQKVKLKL